MLNKEQLYQKVTYQWHTNEPIYDKEDLIYNFAFSELEKDIKVLIMFSDACLVAVEGRKYLIKVNSKDNYNHNAFIKII